MDAYTSAHLHAHQHEDDNQKDWAQHERGMHAEFSVHAVHPNMFTQDGGGHGHGLR